MAGAERAKRIGFSDSRFLCFKHSRLPGFGLRFAGCPEEFPASPAALHVVILAAGEGKRMKSARPKVLMPLAGAPCWGMCLIRRALNPSAIHIVYGPGGDQVRAAFADPDLSWILQSEQRGTGHAVKLAMAAIPDDCAGHRALW